MIADIRDLVQHHDLQAPAPKFRDGALEGAGKGARVLGKAGARAFGIDDRGPRAVGLCSKRVPCA